MKHVILSKANAARLAHIALLRIMRACPAAFRKNQRMATFGNLTLLRNGARISVRERAELRKRQLLRARAGGHARLLKYEGALLLGPPQSS